jgi:hypothetical protein
VSTCNVWHTGLVTECVIRLIAPPVRPRLARPSASRSWPVRSTKKYQEYITDELRSEAINTMAPFRPAGSRVPAR